MTEYWKDQFRDSNATLFPTLPSLEYVPHSDERYKHSLALKWPSSNFTASTKIRAAWGLLLAHHTNNGEAIYGMVTTGRQAPIPHVETVAGPTIATCPMRIVLDESETLRALLTRVQQQASDMVAHEQIGLQNIRLLSEEARRCCAFQTLLVINNFEAGAEESSALLTMREPASQSDETDSFSTYAMLVTCSVSADDLQVAVSFDSNVIKRQYVHRLIMQFEHILDQMTTCTLKMKVRDIEVASELDKADIWRNAAILPSSVEICVHKLFQQVVQRQPEAPAICAWDGEFSYHELDVQSQLLAHGLRNAGVQEGEILPALFEKSKWVPVVMLACARAGAAFCLLDIRLPMERCRSIVRQLHSRIILTSVSQQKTAETIANGTVILVNEEINHNRNLSDSVDILPIVDPSATLYVVLTSGTTGTPKAVTITHANFSTAAHYQQGLMNFSANCRVYDHVAYSFDVSIGNNLHALTSGACVCIPHEDDRLHNIAGSINSLKANYAWLTPTVARMIDPSAAPGLQTINFAGEQLMESDVIRWIGRTVFNSHGPAE
jgi:non-ribosomal peptide synthetase component F